MTMIKKVLLATKNQNDMTSYLRAWGAFTRPELREVCDPIRPPIMPGWEVDWSFYKEVDCIFLHRPSHPKDLQVMEQARMMGIPVWVDHDDDLENITPDNPVFSQYASQDVKEIIRTSIEQADILSVGGKVHAERIKKDFSRTVHLIPNMVDDYLFSLMREPNAKLKRVSWRGSESHRIDLIDHTQQLETLISEFPDWEFRFFGLNPAHLKTQRYIWNPPQNLFQYYHALIAYNASIQIVPMRDTIFNRVKSNLAWSDATLAGSCVVAPGELPEYDRPGVISYDGGFLETVIEAMRGGFEKRRSNWDASRKWIKENILASKVNEMRREILEKL